MSHSSVNATVHWGLVPSSLVERCQQYKTRFFCLHDWRGLQPSKPVDACVCVLCGLCVRCACVVRVLCVRVCVCVVCVVCVVCFVCVCFGVCVCVDWETNQRVLYLLCCNTRASFKIYSSTKGDFAKSIGQLITSCDCLQIIIHRFTSFTANSFHLHKRRRHCVTYK
jgi:hypothetical protein